MRNEGYIVPYTYHSMGMVRSKYRKILEKELGEMWSLAMLLPKHFDPCRWDVKATPRFHIGEHVACYCLSNLWPGVSDKATKDDATKLSTILLFTRGELRGFVTLKPEETRCLPVGARIEHVKAPCWACPNFKEQRCLKTRPLNPEMALLLKFDSVSVLPGTPESKDLREFIRNALRLVRETARVRNIRHLRWVRKEDVRKGIREEDVQNLLEKLRDDIKDHVVCISCKRWHELLEEIVKVMCEKMADELTRMCHDDRIRAIWEFAKVLQVVREVCPGACPEEPG